MSNLSPVDDLKNQIQIMKPQLKAALPPHIDVDKFARVVMTAIVTSPDLAKAQRQSFFGACLKAAADGLIPDGKEAALVTFKNGKTGEINVTYMPMLGGILKKVRNSGELLSITSNIVYKNDKFVWFIDQDGEHVQHNPILFGDRGPAIGVYALAKTKDGGLYIEILDSNQVEKVRQSSKSKDYGPWAGPFVEEMWKKTAIRRLSKRLPMSTDLEQTIRRDDELYEVAATPQQEQLQPAGTVAAVESKKKPNKLKQLITKPVDVPQEQPPVEHEPENDSETDEEIQI